MRNPQIIKHLPRHGDPCRRLTIENRLNMAIKLTKTAAERVRIDLDQDGGIGLRLGVKKMGCSGWAYTVQLAEGIEEDDTVVPRVIRFLPGNPDAVVAEVRIGLYFAPDEQFPEKQLRGGLARGSATIQREVPDRLGTDRMPVLVG